MKRRTFMTTAAGLVATAGCTTRAGHSANNSPSTTIHDTRGTTATGAACPSFVGNADRTVCADSRDDAPVSITQSDERFVDYEANDTVETTRFTLVNESDRPFSLDVNDWAVKRRTDRGWHHVAPDSPPDARTQVAGGGRYEWILGTEPHSTPMSETSQSVVVDLKSAERYAFVVHGSLGDEHIECVARFEYLLAVPGE